MLSILVTDDVMDYGPEPDWQRMGDAWSRFVKRHWGALACLHDWRAAIRHYAPSLGTFTIAYAASQNHLILLHVQLDIRLSDGKISGVRVTDDRALLRGRPAPRLTSDDQIRRAVASATAGAVPGKGIVLGECLGTYWYVKEGPGHGGPQFECHTTFRARSAAGQQLIVNAGYDETTRSVQLERVVPEIDARLGPGPVERPVTAVDDTLPIWSADGKQLFFITARDVQRRPWWRRVSTVLSVAVVAADTVGARPECIRPVKPIGSDMMLYSAVFPSPSGRSIAFVGGWGTLCILDLRQGVMYIPCVERSAGQDSATTGTSGYLPAGAPLHGGRGLCWLPGDAGLLLSSGAAHGRGILCARWVDPVHPYQCEVTAVVDDPGNEILPTLTDDGRHLAYARESGEGKWVLVDGSFDVNSGHLSDRVELPLGDEPQSISWDGRLHRWLLVVGQKLLWVERGKGGLAAVEAAAPMWGDRALKPACASVAPDGASVALSAKLPSPIRLGDVSVWSGLFLWDGRSTQARPAFDMASNDLVRHRFGPAPDCWAKIKGDASLLGTSQFLDPDYIIGEPDGRTP